MTRHIALKRLVKSDLSLFSRHNERSPGNQPAISVATTILQDRWYPNLSPFQSYPVSLSMLGPGIGPELLLTRKIVKQQRNWRLGFEVIKHDERRYAQLADGDFMLIDLSGDGHPTHARALFLARGVAEDAALHRAFDTLLGSQGMVPLDEATVDRTISSAAPVVGHPARVFLLDAALADAAEGGSAGADLLYASRGLRATSLADLRRAKEQAERTGRLGEEFVHDHLQRLQHAGSLQSFDWVSDRIPLSPFDFTLSVAPASDVLLDVKSTRGEYGRVLHVSFGELRTMAGSAARYDLYRVFEMTETRAKLRVATDIRRYAAGILAVLSRLPQGVTPDSLSFDPDQFGFDAEVFDLTLADDE